MYVVTRMMAELLTPVRQVPIVLVHPWYGFDAGETQSCVGEQLRYGIYCGDNTRQHIDVGASYLENVVRLVRKRGNEVFLLEDYHAMNNTLSRMSHLAGKTPKRVVPTKSHDPTPLNSWQMLTSDLPIGEVALAGGLLLFDPYLKAYTGCLGEVHNVLRDAGYAPFFVEGCCYHC